MKFLLGKKIKMSQIFNKDGKVIPITIVKAEPSIITQIKTPEKDGYKSVQIGFERITKMKKIKKSMKGKEYRYLKEFRIDEEYFRKAKIGDTIDFNQFEEGEKIIVSGKSKGRGFQGVVKRHGFHGQQATHGFKHTQRRLGSIGTQGMDRVVKGKKMPGKMGNQRFTIKGLKIIKIDKTNNLLFIKGSVPGSKDTLLELKA